MDKFADPTIAMFKRVFVVLWAVLRPTSRLTVRLASASERKLVKVNAPLQMIRGRFHISHFIDMLLIRPGRCMPFPRRSPFLERPGRRPDALRLFSRAFQLALVHSSSLSSVLARSHLY
jgi:hypothetical protein